jgi:hypothetical protein
MYSFFASLHARPEGAAPQGELARAGQTFPTLAIESEPPGRTPLEVTFERAAEWLAKLERMYCEPDGSFVWVSSQGQPAWQVDGNLYDHAGRLLLVDLKGSCPAEEFDRLLAAFGWPQTALMFQLKTEAVFLDEPSFRRWASLPAPQAQDTIARPIE